METYSLKWNIHTDHLKKVVNDMFIYNYFTDVTIVCDDQKMVNAHKFILSGSSPVFKNILDSLSGTDSVIDLREIKSEDMESILKFLYTGQVTFSQGRSETFLNVARYLDIKEIYKIFDIDDVADNYYEDIVTLDVTTDNDDQMTVEEEEDGITNSNSEEEENLEDPTNQVVTSTDLKQCEFCNLVFESDSSLHMHLKLVHGIYMCPYENCEYFVDKRSKEEFANLYSAGKLLKQHVKSVHLTPDFRYSCQREKCEFVTDRKGKLKEHTLTHRVIRKYNCQFCDQQFTHRTELKQHIKLQHFQDYLKEEKFKVEVNESNKLILQSNALQCKECHIVFEGREHFNLHKQKVHGKYPCPVDNCDYIPQSRTALLVHKDKEHPDIISSLTKPFYECKYCQQMFTEQSSLQKHRQFEHPDIISSHANSFYECNFCQQKFGELSEVKKHIRFVCKKYQCKECSYRTTNLHNLKIHSDQHRNKKYSCVDCNIEMRSKLILRQHEKSGHKITETVEWSEQDPSMDRDWFDSVMPSTRPFSGYKGCKLKEK